MNAGLVILIVAVVVIALAVAWWLLRGKRPGALADTPRTGGALDRRGGGSSRENSERPAVSADGAFLLAGPDGRQLFAELIEPNESVLFGRGHHMPTHHASSIAIDKVLDAVPVIGLAVAGGKWVRILNPEALELGSQIKSHAGGVLGGIYGPDSKFAAQLRFTSPQDLAELATPLAVFKVASAVTGQYYLQKINSQLMTIEGQVRQVGQQLRNETYGEITAAAETCIELEEAFSLSLDLTSDERTRLTTAEVWIDKAFKQKLMDVSNFTDDVHALFRTDQDEIDRRRLVKAVNDASGDRAYDLQLLLYAAAARHKLNLIRAQVGMDEPTGRGRLAAERMHTQAEQMQRDLEAAADALRQLTVTRDEANERWKWGVMRSAPKELDAFYDRGRALAAQLARTTDRRP